MKIKKIKKLAKRFMADHDISIYPENLPEFIEFLQANDKPEMVVEFIPEEEGTLQ